MPGQDCWSTGSEPSLDELLSDPIVLALLRSDGVTRDDVEAAIARARRRPARAAARPVRPVAPPSESDAAGFPSDAAQALVFGFGG